MTAPTQRTGPALRVEGSCEGCCHLRTYAILVCDAIPARPPLTGLGLATPTWCPLLPAARIALGRALVGEAGQFPTPLCSDCGDPLADPSAADECSVAHDGEEPAQ